MKYARLFFFVFLLPVRQGYALDRVCSSYNGYDYDGDGIQEIRSLELVRNLPGVQGHPPDAKEHQGTVLLLVEDRLWQSDPSSPSLRGALRRFSSDLAQEGRPVFLFSIAVYCGERHQDGKTVLALRRFLQAANKKLPLEAAILVGDFPESYLVRSYFWKKHGKVTLFKGTKKEKPFEDVDYWINMPEPVANRADIVLADLDGAWETCYVEERRDLPYFVAAFDQKSDIGDGVTPHVEHKTETYEDFFYVKDGRWVEVPLEGLDRTWLLPTRLRNDECSKKDLQRTNPMAVPEIYAGRINAKHQALVPDPSLLDWRGRPRKRSYPSQDQVPEPKAVWTHSERFERQLLLEYLQRNHQYRKGRFAWAAKPACISTEWSSSLPSIRKAFPVWSEFKEKGYDLHGKETIDLLAFVEWIRRPALLRVCKGHSDPWGTTYGEPKDLEKLSHALGDAYWWWKKDGSCLQPALFENRKKIHFPFYRALYENGCLPGAASMFLHTGCDSISPARARDLPFSHPEYGHWQNAEGLLFYCEGLVLLGRAKVFNDEPRELFEILASGKSWGEAWMHYFRLESMDEKLDTEEQGIRRKKAYFWSLLGDPTLRIQ